MAFTAGRGSRSASIRSKGGRGRAAGGAGGHGAAPPGDLHQPGHGADGRTGGRADGRMAGTRVRSPTGKTPGSPGVPSLVRESTRVGIAGEKENIFRKQREACSRREDGYTSQCKLMPSRSHRLPNVPWLKHPCTCGSAPFGLRVATREATAMTDIGRLGHGTYAEFARPHPSFYQKF